MTNSVRNNSVNMTLHVGVHLYRVFKHSCVLDFLQLIPNDANPVAAEDTAGVPTVEYPPWNICFVMYIMTYMYYTFLSFLLFLYRRTYEILILLSCSKHHRCTYYSLLPSLYMPFAS